MRPKLASMIVMYELVGSVSNPFNPVLLTFTEPEIL
jgi:hypothetical protein